MSYQVRTEQMRVAVARSEHDQALVEIDRKLDARIRTPHASGITDKDALIKARRENEESEAIRRYW